MAIISGFPGKSKPKLQDITVVPTVFCTSSTKWEVYDSYVADSKFDGIGTVKVKKLRPRAVALGSEYYDASNNTFTFTVYGSNITASSPEWLGMVLYTDATWEADTSNRKLTQSFCGIEKYESGVIHAFPILTSFDTSGGASVEQYESSLLPGFIVKTISTSQLIISPTSSTTIKTNVSYAGYLIYNAVDNSQ